METVLKQSAVAVRVLVVEDDHVFRRLICDTLVRKGYDVQAAENGMVAKSMIELTDQPFEVVISDIRMPQFDGIALLQFVKENSPGSKFLLMTGFDELIEAMNAQQLGADEFLSKPFRSDALVKKIESCLNPSLKMDAPEEEEEPADNLYCQIPLEHFLAGSSLVSDIYIKLAKNRYIKVAAQEEVIPVERLKTYKAKKVESLYVRKEDFGKYVHFSMKVTRLAAASEKVSTRQKAILFRNTTEILCEQVHLAGLDKNTLGFAKGVVEDAIKTVSQDQMLLGFLSEMSQRSDALYAHLLGVSVISSLIAKEHGWSAPPSLFKCAVGGLFHDIGKREIEMEILTKPRLLLTAAEVKHIESHPIRGRDILHQITCLPDEIALIAYHHHENCNGTGYPQGLTKEAIHPVARIIGVADRFANLCFPVQKETAPLSPAEAISRMTAIHADTMDPQFFKRLLALFPDATSKSA